MVLELHVWGPAFDLASIDAQCLAVISYFQLCLPSNSWTLIPSSNGHAGSINELPALRNGKIWISGLMNIISYLNDVSNGRWNLDRDLRRQQQADLIAYSTFILSRAQPLLDLSLYVSSENYHHSTRPALANILVWPDSWTLPHILRDRARRRSTHLGLDALDIDIAKKNDNKENALVGQIPKSLRRPKQTVSGLLGHNAQTARFRLDAVTSDFFEPLSQLLGKKEWLLGDGCTSLDCLAFGYLALMQEPALPHSWLKDALNKKNSNLGIWTRNLMSRVLVSKTKDGSRMSKVEPGGIPKLPWRKASERSWFQVGQAILDNCLMSLPVIGPKFVITEVEIKEGTGQEHHQQKQQALQRLRNDQIMYSRIVASSATFFIIFGAMLWNGWLSFPRRSSRLTGRRFGEAGAMLGLR